MKFIAKTNGEVALVANTDRTFLQYECETTSGAKLLGLSIGLDGLNVDEESILLTLERQSSAGTGGAAGHLRQANDSDADTIPGAVLQAITTTNPTAIEAVWEYNVPPGGLIIFFPEFFQIKIGLGDRLGVRLLLATGLSSNATIAMFLEG